MATILWPWEVLWAGGVSVDLAPRTLAGPSSISGKAQTVASDAGIWRVTFSDMQLWGRQEIVCFRGIANLLEGRLNPILVPLLGYERTFQPIPEEATTYSLYDPVPHSDDSPFDDDAEYQGSVVDVTLASALPARATSANITIGVADTIEPGQHFSIGERLYRVRSVTYSSDTAATITFRPPARDAASVGDRLEFDFPVCRMKLASDAEMNLPLDFNVMGQVTVNFVEDV